MEKIIAVISPKRDDAKEVSYTAPDNAVYSGYLSNEAPVKYLLHTQKKIEQIICIVSPSASVDFFKTAITEYMRTELGRTPEENFFVSIPAASDGSFAENTLADLLEHITTEDSIYLDTSGGLRSVITQLTLLSRVLRYQGTALAQAVYANFNKENSRVEDVTDTYQTFDLINGMNEFQQFASADTLDKYFENRSTSPEVKKLVDAIKSLSDSIALGRTTRLEEKISSFQTALAEAKSYAAQNDPMLAILLPVLEKKFGSIQTIPEIIIWCLENNLIQQALTIYNEKMPEYLIKTLGLLTFPKAIYEECWTSYGNEYKYAMDSGFLSMGKMIYDGSISVCECFRQYVRLHKQELKKVRWVEELSGKPDDRYYDAVNHLLKNRYLIDEVHKMKPGEIIQEFPSASGRIAMKNPAKVREHSDNFVQSVEFMDELLLYSGYQLSGDIKPKDFKRICRDYLYIRALRNQMNHNTDTIDVEEDYRNYLVSNGYLMDLEYVKRSDIRDKLTDGLRRIERIAQ